MLRGDPPPRMAKGHVARHAVPPCAREPTLEVHHRHLLLRRIYKEKQKERGANKKKLIASRPRRRQATKIACHPKKKKKDTAEHFHQHNARLEAAEVELTAPLIPFNPSHQLLGLVAGNVLRRRKQCEYVSRVYACNRTSSVNAV